ncbi:MAG: class I SAM-dependent methyltransferase [bacterium]|nr:class I SAM-dependent methyltransferase [bacterium]
MSFSPLPDILRSDLARSRGGVVLELGAGDGRFTHVLAEAGADVIPLDCRHPCPAGGILGDVRALPVRPGAVGLIVAANLLHHLGSVPAAAAAVNAWLECLAPDGCLHLLQDDPLADTPARRNDRDLRDWLARLVPTRGRPIALEELRAALAGAGGQTGDRLAGWSFGRELNRTAPPDRAAVLVLLRGDGGKPDRRTVALAAAIAQDGLDYGWYWWARWRGGAAS